MEQESKTILTAGFRKKFMIWICIASSLILFGGILYHLISGDVNHALKPEEMYTLVGLITVAVGGYTAARALPGSPEYTLPDLRQYDSTLKGLEQKVAQGVTSLNKISEVVSIPKIPITVASIPSDIH